MQAQAIPYPDWFVSQEQILVAATIIVGGVFLGYLVGKVNKRLLNAVGLGEVVEGTPFERTAQNFNTSTVSLIARLSSWFIYIVTFVVAIQFAQLFPIERLWTEVATFMPHLFVAILILIAGVVVGDKVELMIRERLKSVKLPPVAVIPNVAKYTVIFLAILIALGQVGVATGALLILLAIYMFGLVFVGGIAFWDLLASSAAGMYLLLNEPYGIGDRICVGDRCGIVQEVDVFVTHVENEDTEYIIPNRQVFQQGVSRAIN